MSTQAQVQADKTPGASQEIAVDEHIPTTATATASASAAKGNPALRRAPLDDWSVREQLALASLVFRAGTENWYQTATKQLKPFAEPGRPDDWFSSRNACAQYAALRDAVATPKRKRTQDTAASSQEEKSDKTDGSSNSNKELTAESLLVKRLTAQRLAQLRALLPSIRQERRDAYSNAEWLKRAIDNPQDEEAQREVARIRTEHKQRVEREAEEQSKRAELLEEREAARARAIRPTRTPLASTSSSVSTPVPKPAAPETLAATSEPTQPAQPTAVEESVKEKEPTAAVSVEVKPVAETPTAVAKPSAAAAGESKSRSASPASASKVQTQEKDKKESEEKDKDKEKPARRSARFAERPASQRNTPLSVHTRPKRRSEGAGTSSAIPTLDSADSNSHLSADLQVQSDADGQSRASSADRSLASESAPPSPKDKTSGETKEKEIRDEEKDKRWRRGALAVLNHAASLNSSEFFQGPVRERDAASYHDLVLRPMDLSTLRRSLDSSQAHETVLATPSDFGAAFLRIIRNATLFNRRGDAVSRKANSFRTETLPVLEEFLETWAALPGGKSALAAVRRDGGGAATPSREGSDTPTIPSVSGKDKESTPSQSSTPQPPTTARPTRKK